MPTRLEAWLLALPAQFETTGTELDEKDSHECVDGSGSQCLPPLETSSAPAGGDGLVSAESADWSDREDFIFALEKDELNCEGRPDIPSAAFSPINARFETADRPSPADWESDTPESALSDTAPSRTFDDLGTTPGLVNGRTLDEIFTGDAVQITGAVLYELCKVFTMPQIVERTNCGRQGDSVTEPMLRGRLRDHKRKTVAAGSKCEYAFDYELNQGRRDSGHRYTRLPPADLKCDNCTTCLQWRDTVEPDKVFEYWMRKQDDGQTGAGKGVQATTSAAESALSRVKTSEEPVKPGAKRKKPEIQLPCRAKHGKHNHDQARSASKTAATKKRKHSTSDSPVSTQGASSNSGSDSRTRKVSLPPAQPRKALAAKSANIIMKCKATSEKEAAPKLRANGGCTCPGTKVLKLKAA